MPLPVIPAAVGLAGLLYKALAWLVFAIVVAFISNIPKMVAVGVAAWVFSTQSVGASIVQSLEYFFPTRLLSSDLSAYQQILGYAQAWFDVSFFLNLVVSYWTFVAVLAMTKFLMSFFGVK